ncbi:MAG: tyrosine-protein phosphatase [Lachnospiraceae bacterium]|nr:tyrosine-protein phosphatase [Candidatus Darwinimomas equi]
MLTNTRDLGGIKTKDGKTIVHGKLMRGGMLIRATDEEVAFLESIPVTRVVDFRTPIEVKEIPDRDIKTAEFIYLPPIRSFETGITHEKGADASLEGLIKASITKDPDYALKYFIEFYKGLVTTDKAIEAYSEFLRLVAEEKEGAILWHCTGGKDRAGTAAMLIEEILGVSREDIYKDYMLTNEYLEQDTQDFIRKMEHLGPAELVEAPVRDCFLARPEYIEALYESVENKYGSMESFITGQLGVDAAMKAKLRKMYLE